MSQASYSLEMPIAKKGQLADSGITDKRSFLATIGIPFGHFVTRVSGTDTNGKLPVQATDITTVTNVAGFALSDQARESKNDGNLPNYSSGDMVSVLRSGRLYVQVEENVTPASDVYVRFSGKAQIQTVVFSGALITANVVNGSVNGTSLTPTTFATDNATTLAAIATKIEAHPDVETAVSNGTNTITVTSVTDKTVVLANFVVTLGASQATIVITQTQAVISTSNLGACRASADSATAALLANAKYRTTALAGNLAVLEVQV